MPVLNIEPQAIAPSLYHKTNQCWKQAGQESNSITLRNGSKKLINRKTISSKKHVYPSFSFRRMLRRLKFGNLFLLILPRQHRDI
jgi:hypothetical protein